MSANIEQLKETIKQEIESNSLGLVADLITHLVSQGSEDLDLYNYLSKGSDFEYELLFEVIKVVRSEGFSVLSELEEFCHIE